MGFRRPNASLRVSSLAVLNVRQSRFRCVVFVLGPAAHQLLREALHRRGSSFESDMGYKVHVVPLIGS